MTIPAVVFGVKITALGTLRSLAKNGIRVLLDCNPRDIVRSSKYYQHETFLKNNRSEIDFEALASLPYKKLVLIPCSDIFVRQLCDIPEKYKDKLLVSSCSYSALSTLIYKDNFADQVNKAKISAPKSFILNSISDLQALDESIFHNLFLKPVSSAKFMDIYGVKAFRVNSKAEAIERYSEIESNNFSLILQEYIDGPVDSHYFIDGFVDRNGIIKGLFARRRFRIYPVDFGNSCYMKSVPLEEVSLAAEDIKQLLNSIQYRGIFSVEFKKDISSGVLKIIEVNARCWMYVEFATACGLNMPLMAYKDALSLETNVNEKYPVGKRCVYPYYDFNGYRQKVNKDISLIGLMFSWVGAYQPIFTWSDPMPAITGFLKISNRFIKKIFRLAKI